MPSTLRRPMFRGGPVKSEGTGITSGLDQGYADDGRAGFREGEGMFDFFSPEIVTEEEAKTRSDIYPFTKRDPSELFYLTGLGRLGGIGQGAVKTFGKYPQVLDQYKRYITKKEVPDFIAGPKGVTPYQPPGFLSNVAIKEAVAPYLSSAKELGMSGLKKIKDYGLAITGAGGLGYGAYKSLSGTPDDKTPTPISTETEAEKMKKNYEAQIEALKKAHADELAKLTGTTDSGEGDIAKYAKEARDLLGYEEAKKQSIYDALLAASPGFFKGRNLREAAPNILESINKSGAFDKPTNIKQAAAQLAIQRKMLQEKAIAEEKTRYGLLEAREGLKSKSPIERLKALGGDPSTSWGGNLPSNRELLKPGFFYQTSDGKLVKAVKDEKTKLVIPILYE